MPSRRTLCAKPPGGALHKNSKVVACPDLTSAIAGRRYPTQIRHIPSDRIRIIGRKAIAEDMAYLCWVLATGDCEPAMFRTTA